MEPIMLELNFPISAIAKTLGKTHQPVHRFCNENNIEILS